MAQDPLEDCIKPDIREVWNNIRMNDCNTTFAADSSINIFPRTCCPKHIKHDKREPGFFKEEFCCTEMICLCSKTYCCFDQSTYKIKILARDSTKECWRNLVLDPWKKTDAYRTRKQMCSQLIETSELSNIQSASTNKLKDVHHTFILKELYSMMACAWNQIFCKWNDSVIILLCFVLFQM